jgi:hypothetical protein
MREQLSGTDQRLGRHAAGVQAIAAHAVFLDQRDLGLDRRRDVGRHQTRPNRPPITTKIAVETRRLGPVRIDAFRVFTSATIFLAISGNMTEQDERTPTEPGDRMPFSESIAPVECPRSRKRQGADQHAKLADPDKRPDANRVSAPSPG